MRPFLSTLFRVFTSSKSVMPVGPVKVPDYIHPASATDYISSVTAYRKAVTSLEEGDIHGAREFIGTAITKGREIFEICPATVSYIHGLRDFQRKVDELKRIEPK